MYEGINECELLTGDMKKLYVLALDEPYRKVEERFAISMIGMTMVQSG